MVYDDRKNRPFKSECTGLIMSIKLRSFFVFLIAVSLSVLVIGCGSDLGSKKEDLTVTKSEVTKTLPALLPRYQFRIQGYPRSKGSFAAFRGRVFGKYKVSVGFVIFLYSSEQQEMNYRHLRPPIWKDNEVTMEIGNYIFLIQDKVKLKSKKQRNEYDDITANVMSAMMKLTPDFHGEP